jgi:hypothetical protein
VEEFAGRVNLPNFCDKSDKKHSTKLKKKEKY